MGQTIVPYLNGTAEQLSCNCYRLTEAVNGQGGSVWLPDSIDLSDPFDFTFDVYLGDVDGNGADGMAFLLQTVGTAAGITGGGIGYQTISPSIGIEIDTWQNTDKNDPVEDHIGIQANGVLDHATASNLAGPESALVGGVNIEDGVTHLFRVVWDPGTLTLEAYMDGSLRVSYTGDMVADHFGGDPMVLWGFTGSTGGANNRHEFCFSVIPGLTADLTTICDGEEIVFSDDSYSTLGDVVSWEWDFDNGQTSSEQSPGGIVFDEPGTYTVTQTIVDAVGCEASDSIEIQVDPTPVADFSATEVCQGDTTWLIDQSTVSSGFILTWSWDISDGPAQHTSTVTNVYDQPGEYEVSVLVMTDLGCIDSVINMVEVFENPLANVSSEANSLDATFTTDLLPGENVEWFILDTSFTGLSTVNYTFPDSGTYQILAVVENENGCIDSIYYSIHVEGIPEYTVPNVFTPNGDDRNAVFQPYTYSMTEATLDIYNHWGRPVYKYEGAIPPAGDWGWDGTINGKADAAEGTYYYVLGLKGSDGNSYPENGTVTLLR